MIEDKKAKLREILELYSEYQELFNVLNKITFHNMAKIKKIINELKQPTTSVEYEQTIKIVKIQLYASSLELDDIVTKIKGFSERVNKNEQI